MHKYGPPQADTDEYGAVQKRSPTKKSKRSHRHKSSRKRGDRLVGTTTSNSSAKATLTRAALRTSLSSNTLSNYFSNIGALLSNERGSLEQVFVTRDEVEAELENLTIEISKLQANIDSLKQEKKQKTLEQKLTFLIIIRRSLFVWNVFLVVLLFYDTFKHTFVNILLMMRDKNNINGMTQVSQQQSTNNSSNSKRIESNAIALIVLFLQNFPTIFRQTIYKAIKTSVPFVLALACLIQGTEIYRNCGSGLSITYSLYLLFKNYRPKSWKHFKFHLLNLLLNGCFISMRYYWLHGLSSYENFALHL